MKCIKCGEEISADYGSIKYCSKRCAKNYLKSLYREKNREKILAYAEKYRVENREEIIERRREYNKLHPKKYTKKPKSLVKIIENKIREKSNYKGKYPARLAANNALNQAIISGRIKRPKVCSMCNSRSKIAGHHNDYSKPLAVVWVCYRHHKELQKITNDEYLEGMFWENVLSIDKPGETE